ncbi:unnamed protein product, partial [Rotaria sp. Silwood1]
YVFTFRGDSGRRFILQQPLLYSETAYNYRRLGELWYQLMHSGDIDRLKEYTLCCFEYLLSKIHGLSIEQLLWEFDIICNRYSEHIESLYSQAYEWCELCGASVFVPLSSWLSTIPPMIITVLPCTDGAFKIAPTTFNQHVFCTTRHNEIAMYHIPSKKLVKKFTGHTELITSIRLTYNSKFLVSTSTDRTVKLFNLNSGDLENTYSIHQDEILCMTVSHNNEQIVTGSRDRFIVVIRLETGEVEHSIEQHTDAVTAIALTQDDTILISASRDQTIKRWTFRGMQLVNTIDIIGSPIRHMVISTDDTFIIVACDNTSVQVKSLVTGSDIHHLEGHSSEVTSLSVSHDSMCCYVGCSNAHIYVYNLRSRALLRKLSHHDSSVNDLYISTDDYFLFSAAENAIHVLNVKQQFNGFFADDSSSPTDSITALSISREGDVAIAGSASGIVQLFNLIDGEFTEQIVDHRAPVTQVALSHSYLFSLSGSRDTTVKVYDNEMGEIVAEFTAHSAAISHLRILEDNRKILSSDEQNYIKTWWANTGELIDSYNVPCKMLGVSPDGKYVVSGNGDNILKIWSLDDARVVRSIDHTEGKITCIAFRTDSQYLITGGEDCSSKLWELSSGKLTQVLVEHEQSITAVAISEDGKHVLTGDKSGLSIIWSFKDASQDGLLSAWSTITGIHLATFHFNQNLVKLLVSQSGARYAAILQNSPYVAMLSLFNIPFSDASRMVQRHSEMFSDGYNTILPIKPKPLLYPKDSTILTNSRESSKIDQLGGDMILIKSDIKIITMNIENFEYYSLYKISSPEISNHPVIKFIIRFHLIYPWLLFPFGFIGSLLTILIFRRKKFKKFGCSILFVAESVMDLLLITINCIHLIILYTFKSHFFQNSIYLYRVYKFSTNYFSHCALWILCIISLERAAVTRRFDWNQNVFNRKHSYCILVIIYTVLFFLNIHYLIFFLPEPEKSYLYTNNEVEKKSTDTSSASSVRLAGDRYDHFLKFYLSWMDFITNSLIPFIIILIANATVMYSVCKSHILMKELGLRQTRSPRDTQLAYILFVSTLLFLLLTFPLRVFSVIEPYLRYERQYLMLLDGIMRFLLYLDHGCGFYLYTFTGELFRREFKKFFNDFLYLIFRRRFFNWSSIESRRQSDISGSTGGPIVLHIVYSNPQHHHYHHHHHPQQEQHGNIKLQDSPNICGTNKSSLHPLQLQKSLFEASFHPQCTYTRPRHMRSSSSSPCRSTVIPNIGQEPLFKTTTTTTTNNNNHNHNYRHHHHHHHQPDPMSKSQSKEFFKKKQRGQNKKNSASAVGISIVGPSMSNLAQGKAYHIQTSHGSTAGLVVGSEDPAVVVISPHPTPTIHQTKEKRTKICCLL